MATKAVVKALKKQMTPDMISHLSSVVYILNKIAEGVAHGLNSREISREIPKVTKAELISCISRLITD